MFLSLNTSFALLLGMHNQEQKLLYQTVEEEELSSVDHNAGLLNSLLLYVDVIFEEFFSFIESLYGDGSEQSNHTDDGDIANFGSSISKDICMGRVHLNCGFFVFFFN